MKKYEELSLKEAKRETKITYKLIEEKQNNDFEEEEEEENYQIKMSKSTDKKITTLDKFWKYYEKQSLSLIEKGILNYSQLYQKYRSNSIIEGYHSLLQQKIPKNLIGQYSLKN